MITEWAVFTAKFLALVILAAFWVMVGGLLLLGIMKIFGIERVKK